MKNNPNLILAILLLLVIACSCPKSESSRTSQISTPSNTAVSTTPQALLLNMTVPPPLKSSSSKSASVITENAALRESPNGKISQTLPITTRVEVIKQKGAWFYVKSGAMKGWMHGNTIRYNNQSDVSSVPTTRSTYTDSKPKPESSGASAKCRDGSLSYSQSRRGTCSHHDGVAVWY